MKSRLEQKRGSQVVLGNRNIYTSEIKRTADIKKILQDLGKCYSTVNVVFKCWFAYQKLFNWSFNPDFYDFCNFVRKAAPILINWSPLGHVKCLQKLHACVHAHKKISSFWLLKANVLFISIKCLAGNPFCRLFCLF